MFEFCVQAIESYLKCKREEKRLFIKLFLKQVAVFMEISVSCCNTLKGIPLHHATYTYPLLKAAAAAASNYKSSVHLFLEKHL